MFFFNNIVHTWLILVWTNVRWRNTSPHKSPLDPSWKPAAVIRRWWWSLWAVESDCKRLVDSRCTNFFHSRLVTLLSTRYKIYYYLLLLVFKHGVTKFSTHWQYHLLDRRGWTRCHGSQLSRSRGQVYKYSTEILALHDRENYCVTWLRTATSLVVPIWYLGTSGCRFIHQTLSHFLR